MQASTGSGAFPRNQSFAEQRSSGSNGGNRGADDLPSLFHSFRHVAAAAYGDRARDIVRVVFHNSADILHASRDISSGS